MITLSPLRTKLVARAFPIPIQPDRHMCRTVYRWRLRKLTLGTSSDNNVVWRYNIFAIRASDGIHLLSMTCTAMLGMQRMAATPQQQPQQLPLERQVLSRLSRACSLTWKPLADDIRKCDGRSQ